MNNTRVQTSLQDPLNGKENVYLERGYKPVLYLLRSCGYRVEWAEVVR